MTDIRKAGQYMVAVAPDGTPVLVQADADGKLIIAGGGGGGGDITIAGDDVGLAKAAQLPATLQNGSLRVSGNVSSVDTMNGNESLKTASLLYAFDGANYRRIGMVTDAIKVINVGITPTQSNATIANGESLSNTIDLDKNTLVAIHMPALWTAANITLQGSENGTTFDNLFDRFGNEITYNVAGARMITIPPAELYGIRYIRLRSGTSAVPVNQGAARTIVLITKAV